MAFAFIETEKANLPIRFMCDQLAGSTSGFYKWRAAQADPCQRVSKDTELAETLREIHATSRQSYGVATAELRLGLGHRVNHKRVERLMRTHGIQGLHQHRRNEALTRRDPNASPATYLVNRHFRVTGPDRSGAARSPSTRR